MKRLISWMYTHTKTRETWDSAGLQRLGSAVLITLITVMPAVSQKAATQSSIPAPAGIAPTQSSTPSISPTSEFTASQIQIGPVAEASTGNGIEYHGGPLMLTTHNVYIVWYGNWNGNSATTLIPQYIQNLSNSPYFSINTTYEDGSNKNIGSSVGMSTQTFDNYSQGASLNDTSIRNIVSGAISRGALPVDANGIYFVLTSGDVTETTPGNPPKTFCTDFCGWHTHASLFGTDIKYAFVGDASPQCINNPSNPKTCAGGGNQLISPNGNTGADAMINTMSHELAETVTDPDQNAWYHLSNTSGENGDLCNFKFGPLSRAPNGSSFNLTLAGVNYLAQKNWLNDTNWQNPNDPSDPPGTFTNCTMASTGNVFLYASAHDEYYACHGMVSGSTTDCNNITDSNDRLICQAVAQHSQTPCSTPVTDRNLQLSCFGIAFAPNFPSNCRDITNPQMQSFCYGVSSGGSPVTPNCSTVADPDTRALCNGLALHDASQCSAISSANDRQFCLGVATRTASQCSTISSCPDPSAQASCLDNGGTWNWSSCSCTMPVVCDPAQQQACINGGGIWDPSTCSCNPGCGTQIICAQQPVGEAWPLKSSGGMKSLQSVAVQ